MATKSVEENCQANHFNGNVSEICAKVCKYMRVFSKTLGFLIDLQ